MKLPFVQPTQEVSNFQKVKQSFEDIVYATIMIYELVLLAYVLYRKLFKPLHKDPSGTWAHRFHRWLVNFVFYQVTPVTLPVFFETFLNIIYTDRVWTSAESLLACMVTGLVVDIVGQALALMQAGCLAKATAKPRGKFATFFQWIVMQIIQVLAVVNGALLNAPHAIHASHPWYRELFCLPMLIFTVNLVLFIAIWCRKGLPRPLSNDPPLSDKRWKLRFTIGATVGLVNMFISGLMTRVTLDWPAHYLTNYGVTAKNFIIIYQVVVCSVILVVGNVLDALTGWWFALESEPRDVWTVASWNAFARFIGGLEGWLIGYATASAYLYLYAAILNLFFSKFLLAHILFSSFIRAIL